jgi:hypothetical protein
LLIDPVSSDLPRLPLTLLFTTKSFKHIRSIDISKPIRTQKKDIEIMTFNSMHRVAFAICLTAFIFAAIVGVLCFIHHQETRRARQAETANQALPPRPAEYGINLPQLSTNNDFGDSDETLVAPAVSAM